MHCKASLTKKAVSFSLFLVLLFKNKSKLRKTFFYCIEMWIWEQQSAYLCTKSRETTWCASADVWKFVCLWIARNWMIKLSYSATWLNWYEIQLKHVHAFGKYNCGIETNFAYVRISLSFNWACNQLSLKTQQSQFLKKFKTHDILGNIFKFLNK